MIAPPWGPVWPHAHGRDATMTDPIAAARAAGRTLLTEVESKQLLEQAGIPVVSARLATSADEAARIADETGYPVVLKVVSAEISHKSDIGGVELNLADASAVRAAYGRIEAAVAKTGAATEHADTAKERQHFTVGFLPVT